MPRCHYAIDYAMRFVGHWYTWGGDDPSGFDCSGFVVEYLKSFGAIPRQSDYTAAQLWSFFENKRHGSATPGGLIFYRNLAMEICHVEITLDWRYQLGASGGGSRVRSIDDAILHNAFIKMRPIGSNRGLIVAGYVRLFSQDGIPLTFN